MYHILVNPASSSGTGMEIWKRIQKKLEQKQIVYEVHMLDAVGAATKVTASLTSDRTEDIHLIVLGGDGTMNEVLNGIQDFDHTKVSCIRTGSGNDFARNMKLEKNQEQALDHILEQPEEYILDYGIATATGECGAISKRFLISCGVGYDADICVEVEKSKLKKVLNKVKLGKLVYVLIGIKQVFTRENCRAKLYLDDGEMMKIQRLFFVVGMQHEYEGGGVPFCPKADPRDGMLDVCLVRDLPKWKILIAIALVYLKKHYIFKTVTAHTCQKMRIVTEKPQWFHTDGETSVQVTEVTWESKSGLRFVK